MSSLPRPEPGSAARPRLRGVLHQAGFAVVCLVGVAFLSTLDGRRLAAAAVFAAAAAIMLGASALHRISWSVRIRVWMRRVDHAGIYLLIAGTYTPVPETNKRSPSQGRSRCDLPHMRATQADQQAHTWHFCLVASTVRRAGGGEGLRGVYVLVA